MLRIKVINAPYYIIDINLKIKIMIYAVVKIKNKEEEAILLKNLQDLGYKWINGNIPTKWKPSINSIIQNQFPFYYDLDDCGEIGLTDVSDNSISLDDYLNEY